MDKQKTRDVGGPDKCVLNVWGLWESNKTYSLPPPKYLSSSPLSLTFSLSLIHTHTNTQIPPKVYFPGSKFIRTLPATLYNGLLSLWADAESKLHYHQFTSFLSSVQRDAREGSPALYSFCPQGGTIGSWPDLFAPPVQEGMRPV